MDQDQQEKQRHLCKYCNKSFANGKVLGGHMRCHATKNPLKNQAKFVSNNDDACFEGSEKTGYGLRVNPKKSSRVSPSTDRVTTSLPKDVPCGVCGKEFETMRALFGHMRHHSKRGREMVYCCRDCDREFESFRALSCHMKSHAERGLIEKRFFSESSVIVKKKKRSRRSRLKLSPSISESSSTVGADDADREVEEIAACLLMLSQVVSVEAVPLKKARIDCEGGFLDSKKLCNESESLNLSMEVSDPTGDEIESNDRRSEYRCRTCNKIFHSHQALGGHQTIHRSTPEHRAKFVAEDPAEFEAERIFESNKEHKCHICLKVFASGQALGGHKRAHVVRDQSEAEAEETPLLSHHHRQVCDSMDSDDDLGSPLPWWIRSSEAWAFGGSSAQLKNGELQ